MAAHFRLRFLMLSLWWLVPSGVYLAKCIFVFLCKGLMFRVYGADWVGPISTVQSVVAVFCKSANLGFSVAGLRISIRTQLRRWARRVLGGRQGRYRVVRVYYFAGGNVCPLLPEPSAWCVLLAGLGVDFRAPLSRVKLVAWSEGVTRATCSRLDGYFWINVWA